MTEPATSSYFCARCGTRRGSRGACERDGTELVEITPSSLLGTEVGNYVLVQMLGEGGMGVVYRAVQPKIGAEVAIKVLHASPGEQAQRFLLEAQAVNRVKHPNLIRILDTGYLTDRRPYLVMELLDGMALAEAVGVIAPPIAARVAAEVLDALEAVHRVGIVHRDLKPPNVFLATDGRVVVLDFGIAKLVDGEVVTHSSGLVGTPEYMAPEQIRAQPVDRRTDIYAIGVMLYETITGRRPFLAAATFDMLVQHLEQPPTSPREYAPNLTQAVADVILRAMEKQPDRRYDTAAQMASALRATNTATRDELIAYVASRVRSRPPIETRRPATATAHDRPVSDGAPATRREGPGRREASNHGRVSEPPRALSQPTSSRRWRVLPIALAGVAAVAGGIAWVVFRDGAHPAFVAPRETQPAVVAPTHDGPPAPGIVEITSTPDGAEIVIDHVARGRTPVTVTLSPGAHPIHAELAGHLAIDEAVEARGGEHGTVMIALPDAPRGSAAPVVVEKRHHDTTNKIATGSGTPATPATTAPDSGSASDAAVGSATPTRKPNPFQHP